jgi:hypothetical protein
VNGSKPLLPNNSECITTLLDVQHPGLEERLHRGRAGWRSFASIERFYPERVALVIRPGAVLELTK